MSMRTQNQPWLSPVGSCPFCERDLIKLSHFIDGRTTNGPWTLMCKPCHTTHGTGFGDGNGQLYKFNTEDETYYKV